MLHDKIIMIVPWLSPESGATRTYHDIYLISDAKLVFPAPVGDEQSLHSISKFPTSDISLSVSLLILLRNI